MGFEPLPTRPRPGFGSSQREREPWLREWESAIHERVKQEIALFYLDYKEFRQSRSF